MATAGSWSTNWSTGEITTDGVWYTATESAPSSAFSYVYPKSKDYGPYLWFDEKSNKLQTFEREYAGEFEETLDVKKDHLSELEELFEI